MLYLKHCKSIDLRIDKEKKTISYYLKNLKNKKINYTEIFRFINIDFYEENTVAGKAPTLMNRLVSTALNILFFSKSGPN